MDTLSIFYVLYCVWIFFALIAVALAFRYRIKYELSEEETEKGKPTIDKKNKQVKINDS